MTSWYLPQRLRTWYEYNSREQSSYVPAQKDTYDFHNRTRVHQAKEILQTDHKHLVDAALDVVKPSFPDADSMTLQRRARDHAWDSTTQEIRNACMAAVSEEKKVKQEMKALEASSESGPRTAAQYAEYVVLSLFMISAQLTTGVL